MINVGLPPVRFQGRATGNQTLATSGTYYPINLTVEDVDTADGHSTTTNTSRFVVPTGRGGPYELSGAVVWASNAASSGRVIGICKNGAFLSGGTNYGTIPANATMTQPIIPFEVTLAAGDYIEILATAGTANVQTYGDTTTGSLLRVKYLG